jgi:hypothetical protein
LKIGRSNENGSEIKKKLQNEKVFAYLKTTYDHALWNVLKMQPSMFGHTPSISSHSLDFVDLNACDAPPTFSI